LENNIFNYLTTNHFKNYEVSDYILSNNSEVSLDNINIFNPFIKINNAILFVIKKKKRPEPEKSINQENFLTELRNQLNEIHIESGRSFLEGGELSNT